MNMLYDSDSFVVVHFQPEALPVTATEGDASTSSIVIDGSVPLKAEAKDASDKPMPRLARNGFEIVDKRSGREIYLDGSWAEMFQLQIVAWQENTPTQEEVEDTLDRYASLAQQPVTVH
jgi:hypothetical protein